MCCSVVHHYDMGGGDRGHNTILHHGLYIPTCHMYIRLIVISAVVDSMRSVDRAVDIHT